MAHSTEVNRFGPLLFILLFASGCGKVGLEIETVVHEDGSFDRTVTYTTWESDRGALTRDYILPTGANWEVTETTELSNPPPPGFFRERLSIYRARGTFRGLETDYAKSDSRQPPSFSRNRISVRSTPDSYEYAESFSDATDVTAMRRVAERFVREWAERTVAGIREALFSEENPAVVESIQRHVATSALGYFGQIWHGLETAESTEQLESIEMLIRQSDEFLISQIDQWWRVEGLHYPAQDARKRIAQTATEFFEKDSKEGDAWMDSYKVDIKQYGGAYFPSRFRGNYPFKVTVTMPEKITETNADQVKDNTATWEFGPLIFWLKNYTLVAKAERVAKGE